MQINTIAKTAIARVVSTFFEKYTLIEKYENEITDPVDGSVTVTFKKKLELSYMYSSTKIAANFIQELKEIVLSNRITYESISGYFFGIVKRRLSIVLKRLELGEEDDRYAERLQRFLSALLEVAFFIYAMNPRVRPTYQISEMAIAITEAVQESADLKEIIIKQITDEVTSVIRNNCITLSEDNIELLNLLIVLKTLGNEHRYDEQFLCDMFKIGTPSALSFDRNRFGYFQITTMLHYIEKSAKYSNFSTALHLFVKKIFQEEKDWQESSELAALFLDYIRCPHIKSDIKLDLVKVCLGHTSTNNITVRAKNIVDAVMQNYWFFKWNGGTNLTAVLQRKELRTPY